METQSRPENVEIRPNWAWRGRSFATILRMGHCAPAVMQALLVVSSIEKEWLIRLSAGMPGGIGNTGAECGAITSPLVMLGLRYGLGEENGGLPVIFDRGHAFCRHFLQCHCTMQCREIRGKDGFPWRCIGPVTRSPERFLAILDGHGGEALQATSRETYTRLYAYMIENDFHCARAVLSRRGYTPAEDGELFAAVSAFMGGTLFMGSTCSALAAGVMVVGLEQGEIENSYLRVIRMLAIMTAGGNAFDERLNKFNRSMNAGYRLAKWFVKEFGNTQCRAITGCDFSSSKDVSEYIDGGCIGRCRQIAEQVAVKVRQMLAEGKPAAVG